MPKSSPVRTADHVDEVHFAFLDGHAHATPTLRGAQSPATPPVQQIQHLAGTSAPTTIIHLARLLVFLVLLGIIPSTIIFLVDISVHKVFDLRESIIELDIHSPLAVFLFALTGVALCLASTFVCHLCSTEAEGSGIPAMKSLMSGFYDKVKPALSLWALLAKTVGLVCAIGGGLPVGWEGPNVHISCIVAHHLSRLPPFRALRRDRALRMQIMACACAVGLASSFGTPIGGVLYALETTASFYLVPTFWKCVLATLAGSFVYDMLYKTPLVEAFANTSFGDTPYRGQLPAFMLLGALLGLLGAFFVRCVHTLYLLRKRRLPGTNRYVLLFVFGLVAALLQYPLPNFRLDPRLAINDFFSAEKMDMFSLPEVAILVLVKFPLIVISIGLPVPAGVFIPCFLVGAGLGRLYGELLNLLFGQNVVAGGYAVVGAAAFTAGVTRALSVAVVIFEVTGQLKHTMPTLAAVLISVIFANGINRSLYDALIIMKRLPYMPHMRRDRTPEQKVHHIMRTDVISLPEFCSLVQIRETLDKYQSFDSFPIVTKDGLLLGSVRRRSLLNLITRANANIPAEAHTAKPIERHAQAPQESEESPDKDLSVQEADLSVMESEDEQARKQLIPQDQLTINQSFRTRLEPDLSPLIVTANTSLSQLHFMFVMLMPTHAYVLIGGELQGIVTRGDLVQSGEPPNLPSHPHLSELAPT
ncbi:Chloride channel protein F [Gracilariopsis chorda]|uniref:Chloride channel protein n=1 Tax=Gracilariopsis chorda TaxID=448386 RepID=A0A2V3IJD9_9FLOR|nr:Chloride channel protein F [Gracilariopsis chorda]|eukprot:PXF42153.1 Chloride channel protein F [Gracilariopsis chorda]